MLENVLEKHDYPYFVGSFTDIIEGPNPLAIDRRLFDSRLKTIDKLRKSGGIDIICPEEQILMATINTGHTILEGLGFQGYDDPTLFMPNLSVVEGFSEILGKLFSEGFLFSASEKGEVSNRIRLLGLIEPTETDSNLVIEQLALNNLRRVGPNGFNNKIRSLFIITESGIGNYKRGVGRELFFRLQNLPYAMDTRYFDNLMLLNLDFQTNNFLITEAYRF